MESTARVSDMERALADVPILDGHTHLVGGRLGARGLHDILLYHMAVSDLYAAGCPNGARLTQYPDWPNEHEAHARIEEALPYLKRARNTSIAWGTRIILRDLYDWHDEITADNWKSLDARVRERADDRRWHREVARRAGIRRFCTELVRREDGRDDDILHYALEWAFFTRCQWGEFDTALYELERCWGNPPSVASPIGTDSRPPTGRVIHTLDDVHAAVDWYVDQIPVDEILSMATHISTDIDLSTVSPAEMEQALARRSQAVPAERDTYASYINEVFLSAFEELRSCRASWRILAVGRVLDGRYNAGAGETLKRKTASLGMGGVKHVKCNIDVPWLAAGPNMFYFYPDRIFVVSWKQVAVCTYESLSVGARLTRFIETDGVPSDSQVVGHTWRFVNKNGSPDRRFKDNRQIPIAQYEELKLSSAQGIQELYHFSRVGRGESFANSLSQLSRYGQSSARVSVGRGVRT